MNEEDTLILTLKKMAAQLRQDFVRMLIAQLPMSLESREVINETYHFSFPKGSYFVFLLSAGSKVPGQEFRPQWLAVATKHIHSELSAFCDDFETLIDGKRIYCVGGTTLPQWEISKRAAELLEALQQKPEMYTCQWTMGLSRCVSDFSHISECVFSAQHALKYSVVRGTGKFYDGNHQSGVFEGGLTLITPAEQLSIQQALQKLDTKLLTAQIRSLFEHHWSEIQDYPVYAYMLSRQCLQVSIQVLRENMPVDRKTYVLEQIYEQEADNQTSLEALISHTTAGVFAMADRYRLFLDNGRSRPIWLVIAYIQEHFTEKITLEDLARCADRNPHYISAIFSRECGISISEYIASLRVAEAKKLLRSTTAPISDIAQLVGYQDPRYFSRIFRKQTGFYPRAYRQAETAQIPAEKTEPLA